MLDKIFIQPSECGLLCKTSLRLRPDHWKMSVMKHLSVTAMLAAVLMSAPACSAETPEQTAQATPDAAPTSNASSGTKFNFSIPGDDMDAQPASSGYNFSIPSEDEAPSKGGLGAVELPDDGSGDLADFKSSLEIPADAPEAAE